MSTRIEDRIETLTRAFEAHGYFVAMEPIAGEEALFAASLQEGLDKINEYKAYYARKYHYRGLSKNMLKELHDGLPNPVWDVEVDKRPHEPRAGLLI